MNQEFFFKADMIQAKTLSRLTWGTSILQILADILHAKV